MGKSTISMAIFNCYVSSPEGISCVILWICRLREMWTGLKCWPRELYLQQAGFGFGSNSQAAFQNFCGQSIQDLSPENELSWKGSSTENQPRLQVFLGHSQHGPKDSSMGSSPWQTSCTGSIHLN